MGNFTSQSVRMTDVDSYACRSRPQNPWYQRQLGGRNLFAKITYPLITEPRYWKTHNHMNPEYIYFTGGPEADKLYGPKRYDDEFRATTYDEWEDVGDAPRENLGGFLWHYEYRRKVVSPQNQWISVKDRLPERDDAYFAEGYDGLRNSVGIVLSLYDNGWMQTERWDELEVNDPHAPPTHWMKFTPPPLPPQGDESEEAFNEFYAKRNDGIRWAGSGFKKDAKAIWDAALEYARKEK